MAVTVYTLPATRKRIPVIVDQSDGILTYGKDNLYPQTVEQIVFRSGITTVAIDTLSAFTMGAGFTDPNFERAVIHERDQIKISNARKFNARDLSFFNAFALHFQYNLNFQVAQVTPIFSKFCRFGIPDKNGKVSEIKFSRNWELDHLKQLGGSRKEIFTYPIFNPDPGVVAAQVARAGGLANYPGQILYYTEFPGVYSRTVYDAVLDSIQTSGEIPVFELSNIQNGFWAGTIFKYPGTFEDDEQEREVKNRIAEFSGASGNNSTMIIEVPEDQDGDLLESVQVPERDKMLEHTQANVVRTILQVFGQPPILDGINPESGAVNQENMINSYNFYNARTGERRDIISEVYERWVPFFKTPINPSNDYKINPMLFVPAQTQPAEQLPAGTPKPEANGNA